MDTPQAGNLTGSGVSVAAALGVFLLPCGHPRRRVARAAWGGLEARFDLVGGLCRVTADDLLDAYRKRPRFLDIHQRQGEEGEPELGLPYKLETN